MPDLGRITQSFVLDFKKPVVNRLKVVNGDTANTFVITLKNGGQGVQLNTDLHKVIAVFKRADGQVYTQDAETGCTFTAAGVVTIGLRAASFRSGTNTVELQVYKRENSSATEYPLLATTYPQAFTARNETLTGEGENAPSQLPMLERYCLEAESYAHGGTGTREGEDTDNSKFYSDMAIEAVERQVVAPSITAWLTANYPNIADDMADDISAWLSANMTNPSNPAIDKSLSVSGAAADAKETGLAKQMIMLPFDLDNEHYALECIHHDNFNRTPESEYDVGQNGNESVPMTYTFDTETNDSFKIVDNVLTHPSTTSTRCMFLTNKPNRNFAVTLGLVMPTTSTSIWSSFVWNWTNNKNFCEFRISRNFANNRLAAAVYVTSRTSNVETTLLQASSYGLTGNSVTLVFINDNLYIYFDNTLVFTVFNIAYDKSKACGMFIRSQNSDYRWKSVCVYNIGNAVTVDAGLDADNHDYGTLTGGKRINASITQALSGNVSESYDQLKRDGTVTRFSPYSERFELQYVDGDTPQAKNDSRRSEVSVNLSPKNALFRALVSFDFCLPTDYEPETDPSLADDDFEIIAQFHYDSTGGVVAYNPTPCLKIKNGDLWISQWGRPEQNTNVASSGEYAKVETALKTLTPGRWYHIDLFVRSGYESAHNPLVEVNIDGELVYRNTGLNCPNTVGKVVIHYGIYKSQWYYRYVGNVRTKTYYFDNMKVRWF